MNIKTFTQEEEANTFADGVKVSKFELQGEKYVITYAPFYTEEQLIEARLKNDEEEAITVSILCLKCNVLSLKRAGFASTSCYGVSFHTNPYYLY